MCDAPPAPSPPKPPPPCALRLRRVRASVRARACALGVDAWRVVEGRDRKREGEAATARWRIPSAYTVGCAALRTTATAVVARVQNNDLTELNQTRKSLTETQDALQLVQARTTRMPAPLTRTSRTALCAHAYVAASYGSQVP
jgi:hypothetical protein